MGGDDEVVPRSGLIVGDQRRELRDERRRVVPEALAQVHAPRGLDREHDLQGGAARRGPDRLD